MWYHVARRMIVQLALITRKRCRANQLFAYMFTFIYNTHEIKTFLTDSQSFLEYSKIVWKSLFPTLKNMDNFLFIFQHK